MESLRPSNEGPEPSLPVIRIGYVPGDRSAMTAVRSNFTNLSSMPSPSWSVM